MTGYNNFDPDQWFSKFFSHSSLTNINTVNSSPTKITNNNCKNFTLPTVNKTIDDYEPNRFIYNISNCSQSSLYLQVTAIATWQAHGSADHAELVGKHSFALTTTNGKRSRLRHLKNGIPQGSVPVPLLLNIYTSDLTTTVSRKYAYVDDAATMHADGDWQTEEGVLSKDMARWILSDLEVKAQY